MTACYALLSFCCSLLAIGVCFFLFGFCNSLLSSRLLLLAQAARCLLLTESCSLFLTRYSRATVASLFSTHVFCWSLHVFCGLIIPNHGVLFASQYINILLTNARRSLQSAYYSYHSTLIASYTLFLVARRSLFEIYCYLLTELFALLSSCFSFSFASHSILATRILLLADCCFLFFFNFNKVSKIIHAHEPKCDS